MALYGAQNFRFDETTEAAYVTMPDLSVTAEGHMEVAIHDPTLPFGAIHAE